MQTLQCAENLTFYSSGSLKHKKHSLKISEVVSTTADSKPDQTQIIFHKNISSRELYTYTVKKIGHGLEHVKTNLRFFGLS